MLPLISDHWNLSNSQSSFLPSGALSQLIGSVQSDNSPQPHSSQGTKIGDPILRKKRTLQAEEGKKGRGKHITNINVQKVTFTQESKGELLYLEIFRQGWNFFFNLR